LRLERLSYSRAHEDEADQGASRLAGWYFRETSREHPVEINLRAGIKTGPVRAHLELAPGAGESQSSPRSMLFSDDRTTPTAVGFYIEVIGDGTVAGSLIPV
jgi:hypothetical protein